MQNRLVVSAGSTGDLGRRIAKALLERGATVKALVRTGSSLFIKELQGRGAQIVQVDYGDHQCLTQACAGAACVIFALSGLHEVIVDVQTKLLEAAVDVGVPRFIPSDFSIDFTKLPHGRNRNLDLRREFQKRVDGTSISVTSILNGMFSELLTTQAPFILFQFKRVLYYGDADQPLDFTTKDDTAAFTAHAALDSCEPRFLRIVGDRISPRGLEDVVSEVTGERFRLFRGGRVGVLTAISKITKLFVPGTEDTYPPWQGMQYMRDMFDGRGLLDPLDNCRYPNLKWTTVKDVLSSHRCRNSSE